MGRPAKTPVESGGEVEKFEFVNPFTQGVTYDSFLEAIPEGVEVKEYCAGRLTEEELNWILVELEHVETLKK